MEMIRPAFSLIVNGKRHTGVSGAEIPLLGALRDLLLLSMVLAVGTSCYGQTPETAKPAVNDRVKAIDATLSALVPDGLDGVVLIKSKGSVLLHKPYGFADREKESPMTLATGFDIGSLVKPITKAAILRLEEKGKLSTDDTLSKHFRSVPDDKSGITIDQLLRHTSGLPDLFGGDYDVMPADELLTKIFGAALVSKPGEQRNYSNSGYSLLAMLIEKTSGQPYEQFVRKEIFEPAGVGKIGYTLAGWKKGELAVGYLDGKPWGTPLDHTWAKDGPYWNLRGNGGMLATAEETSAWFEALVAGKVLGPAALKEFLDSSSGMSRTLGMRMIGAAGGNNVFNSVQYTVIDSDFHFHFVTSNAKQPAERVLAKFREELFALAKEAAVASAGTEANSSAAEQPEIFGPGVLSVGEVFRGSFAPDVRTFYFFKKVAQSPERYRIFESRIVDGQWTEPSVVDLGGEHSDLYPSISKDGKRMVFASYRPAPGDTSAKPNSHIWYVDRTKSGWGTPVFISSVNKLGHYHSWVEIGSDGDLYFRRDTPDWKLSETLTSRWNGKEYEPPVLFEAAERWKKWRPDVRVVGGSPSPDGRVIFLDVATRDANGRGASDIWVSFKKGDTWTEPKPLGPTINQAGYDVFPFFSPDGKDLYFVRDFKTFYRISLSKALDSVSTEKARNIGESSP